MIQIYVQSSFVTVVFIRSKQIFCFLYFIFYFSHNILQVMQSENEYASVYVKDPHCIEQLSYDRQPRMGSRYTYIYILNMVYVYIYKYTVALSPECAWSRIQALFAIPVVIYRRCCAQQMPSGTRSKVQLPQGPQQFLATLGIYFLSRNR